MATYFWVGGTGTWDNVSTTNWASSTGGAGGAGVPNNADTANFDANSGTGTVSVAATAVSLNTTLNSATINLSLTGSPTLCTTAGTFTLTLGTLTLNTFTLTCGRFSSNNSNVRTIAFGTGNITLTGNAATIWNNNTATNFSYTGIPNVNASYSGSTGTRAIVPGGTATGGTETNSLNFNVTAGSDTVTINSVTAVKNLNFTGFTGTYSNNTRTIFGDLIISSGMTLTAGALGTTFAATSGTQQITTNGKTLDFPVTQNSPGATLQLQDNLTMGSTRTFTLTAGTLDLVTRTLSTGAFSATGTNTRTVAFGTGKIVCTGSGATIFSVSTATGLTVTGTPTVDCTYSGGVGTRQVNGGGAATYSASNPKVNFNITAGTDTFTLGGDNVYGNVNFTGFTGSYGFTATNPQFFGDLTFGTGMTGPSSATRSLRLMATSGTQTITSNGVTINSGITCEGGGTYLFADALTMGATNTLTFSLGTIKLKNGVTSTTGIFATSGTTQKFLESTTPGSQATLSQASGTVDASYLTIRDINATGGATWNAFTTNNNVNAGNNLGWDFSSQLGKYIYTRRKNKRILP